MGNLEAIGLKKLLNYGILRVSEIENSNLRKIDFQKFESFEKHSNSRGAYNSEK